MSLWKLASRLLVMLMASQVYAAKKTDSKPVTAMPQQAVVAEDVGETLRWAKLYELWRDSQRIGYVHMLDEGTSLRAQILQGLQKTFRPTLIEERAEIEKLGFKGTRYFFGVSGQARFVLVFTPGDLRWQEEQARALAEQLNFDVVYRGNLFANYALYGQDSSDLNLFASLPLNVVRGEQTLHLPPLPVAWQALNRVPGARVAYRGLAGDIVYLRERSDAQQLDEEALVINTHSLVFVRGQEVFVLPSVSLSLAEFQTLFERSNADCALQGIPVSYLYCPASGRGLLRTPGSPDPTLGASLKFVMELDAGFAELTLPIERAESLFTALLHQHLPRAAYSGAKTVFLTRVATDNTVLNGLLDSKIEMLDEGEIFAEISFRGATESARANIAAYLKEELAPPETRLLQMGSERGPASVTEQPQVVGIYYDNDRNWWDQIAPRYSNKDSFQVAASLEHFNYQVEGGGAAARASTSVLSFLSLKTEWNPTHSFWGIEADGRAAFLSHTVSGVSVGGSLFSGHVAPTLRFYFGEARDAPELKFSIGAHVQGETVGANATLRGYTAIDVPLRLSYTHILFDHLRMSPSVIYSPLVFAGNGSSGSRYAGTFRFGYQFADTPYELFASVQYDREQFDNSGNTAIRTELGGTAGLNLRWE